MFTETLIESSPGKTPPRSGWSFAWAFGLEGALVGVLLLGPMFAIDGLPKVRILTEVPYLPPPAGSSPPSAPHSAPPRARADTGIIWPRVIPPRILAEQPEAGPVATGGTVPNGLPGVPNGPGIALFPGMFQYTPPAPKPARHMEIVVGGRVQAAKLIHYVEPEYPKLALMARLEGTVLLAARIDTDGRVEELRVLSGHPLFIPAAMEAVRQWRYQPTHLNEEPVEVVTEIEVKFVLSR